MGRRSKKANLASNETKQLAVTMIDTTWRMFVPTIGCTLLGLQFDRSNNTLPWGLFIGITIGILLTTILIKNQFKALNNR